MSTPAIQPIAHGADRSEGPYPVREVSLLFSDLHGFSVMTEVLGDQLTRCIIERHHRLVREQLASYCGEELELRGDGFLLAFATPARALECAIAIQLALAADRMLYPEESLRVHMGLHVGQAICDGDGYFGRALVVSSRLAEVARPDEILVTTDFKDRFEQDCGLAVREERRVRLKGLRGRHRVYSVAWT